MTTAFICFITLLRIYSYSSIKSFLKKVFDILYPRAYQILGTTLGYCFSLVLLIQQRISSILLFDYFEAFDNGHQVGPCAVQLEQRVNDGLQASIDISAFGGSQIEFSHIATHSECLIISTRLTFSINANNPPT